MSFVWDTRNTRKASKLWRDGHSASMIAREIGTSRNAVVGKAYRMRDMFPARIHSSNHRPQKKKAKPVARMPRRVISPSFVPKPKHDSEVFQTKFTSKSLMDLNDNDCRWPEGENFCGKPQKEGRSSYCEYHNSHSIDAARSRRFKPITQKQLTPIAEG